MRTLKNPLEESSKIRIKDQREKLLLTQSQVSQRSNIAFNKYKGIERIKDGTASISDSDLTKLCEVLHCTKDYILGKGKATEPMKNAEGKELTNPFILDYFHLSLDIVTRYLHEDNQFLNNLTYLIKYTPQELRTKIICGFNSYMSVLRENDLISYYDKVDKRSLDCMKASLITKDSKSITAEIIYAEAQNDINNKRYKRAFDTYLRYLCLDLPHRLTTDEMRKNAFHYIHAIQKEWRSYRKFFTAEFDELVETLKQLYDCGTQDKHRDEWIKLSKKCTMQWSKLHPDNPIDPPQFEKRVYN